MPSQKEIRKSISAPLSSDPKIRQRQKVERKALVIQMKGGLPKRQAQVLKSKPKPKVVQPKKNKQTDSSVIGLAEKLRRRFPS